jgi:hypothetical protein
LALHSPILYRKVHLEEEMSSEDRRVTADPAERRAPGATRTPFEGLVEVGGALGPSFEAQAVNVSEEGMQLRTAYLPEVGQPLSCRFDAGPLQSVLASGEVVWTQPAEKGGEFGVRFTDLDAESVEALKRVCGVEPSPPVQAGSKVRLHIDGLASPMRAKIKDAAPSAVTVGSELGFLRVGKPLELEDAQSGAKRAACIDKVEVAVDPASRVPQLVVTLRYADSDGRTPVALEPGGDLEHAGAAQDEIAAPLPAPARGADDVQTVEAASAKMKGAIATNLARVGPAIDRLVRRAKTTVALLAKKRREGAAAEGTSARRTTAPPPGGGLHATGRRVVRGEAIAAPEEASNAPRLHLTKRKAAVAGAVMIAAILGAIAIKKTHHDTASAAAPEPSVASTQAVNPESALGAASPAQPLASALPPTPVLPASPPSTPALGAPPVPTATALADNASDADHKGSHKKHPHPAPFGNGPVHHGNILHLKMDGAIDAIEGAQQPTGFTVKLPGRKSLEAAGPLAARDSRIATIKVSNDPAGAELTVVFKDGVPNYQVSGRGDTLVIAVAPAGTLDKTIAKKDEKGGKSPKHVRHHKKGDDVSKKGDDGGA